MIIVVTIEILIKVMMYKRDGHATVRMIKIIRKESACNTDNEHTKTPQNGLQEFSVWYGGFVNIFTTV